MAMMTLVRWDDRSDESGKTDQNMTYEVSEEVGFRYEVMHSGKNDWWFLLSRWTSKSDHR